MVSAVQTMRSERRGNLSTGAGGWNCAAYAPMGASARGQSLHILLAPAKSRHLTASSGSPPMWVQLLVTQWSSDLLAQREFLSKTRGDLVVPTETVT